MKKAIAIAWTSLFLISGIALIPGMTPAADPIPLVYVVNSYDPQSFGWTQEEVDGVIKGLAQQGLEQGTHYRMVGDTMDAFVNASEAAMKAQGDRILADIKAKAPSLVITTDDDALQFVGLRVENIPVVFNGINGSPAKYLTSPKIDTLQKPGHNITGVYQTTYFKQSLEFIRSIRPEAKTFAAITDESTTGHALLGELEKVKGALPLELKDVLMSAKMSDWKAKITAWQNQVDCIFLLSGNAVTDENGNLMRHDQTMAWIAENSRLPDTCPWAFQVQDGILLSAADSGEQQGVYTAFLAAEILNGAEPGSLAIVTPPSGVPVLNSKRATKLDLNLPPDLVEIFVSSGRIF